MATEQGGNITVSPEKIRETARRAAKICGKLLAGMDSIEASVSSTAAFWDSEGAQLLYRYFKDDKQEFEGIRQNLSGMSGRLEEIADLYDAAEKPSVDEAMTLPGAILS